MKYYDETGAAKARRREEAGRGISVD